MDNGQPYSYQSGGQTTDSVAISPEQQGLADSLSAPCSVSAQESHSPVPPEACCLLPSPTSPQRSASEPKTKAFFPLCFLHYESPQIPLCL